MTVVLLRGRAALARRWDQGVLGVAYDAGSRVAGPPVVSRWWCRLLGISGTAVELSSRSSSLDPPTGPPRWCCGVQVQRTHEQPLAHRCAQGGAGSVLVRVAALRFGSGPGGGPERERGSCGDRRLVHGAVLPQDRRPVEPGDGSARTTAGRGQRDRVPHQRGDA